MAGNIPGFYTVIDTGRSGTEILREMDSVICPAHKESDPDTGAVHACGHNALYAASIGLNAVNAILETFKEDIIRVHPHAPGAEGKSHGSKFYIVDPVAASLESSRIQLAMSFILLSNGAERAKKVIS